MSEKKLFIKLKYYCEGCGNDITNKVLCGNHKTSSRNEGEDYYKCEYCGKKQTNIKPGYIDTIYDVKPTTNSIVTPMRILEHDNTVSDTLESPDSEELFRTNNTDKLHNSNDTDTDTDTDSDSDTVSIIKSKSKSNIIKKETLNEIFMSAIASYLIKKYESDNKRYDITKYVVKKSLKKIIYDGNGINLVTIDGRKVTEDNCDPEYNTVIEHMYRWLNRKSSQYYGDLDIVNDICDNFVKQSFYPEFERILSEFYKTCINSDYDNGVYSRKKNNKTYENSEYYETYKSHNKNSEEGYIKHQFNETFKNAMKTELILDMLFDIEELTDRDPQIYLSLPSFGILGMTDCENDQYKSGIRLCEGLMIHSEECPKEYKIIFDTVINIRDRVKKLDESQKLLVKYKLLPEKTTPDELEKLVTLDIVEIVTLINSASIDISRTSFYKQDIDNIIEEIIAFLV